MSFSDLFFLYFFLPLCLLIYYRAKRIPTRNLILIIFSLVFYAWAEPVWVVLLLLSAVCNWFLGKQITAQEGTTLQKPLVAAALVFNIGMLLVFKYSGFFVENLNLLFRASLPVPQVAQPIGLSFYTFRAISYIMDVYWKKNAPQDSFPLFLLYLSFFPHMTAGPIVRYGTMENDLTERRVSANDLYVGTMRVLVGLAKKVILANHLLVIVDSFFGNGPGGLSTLGTWYVALLYTLYIYFDFSGYSDMAIGIARLFGFRFEENFDYPLVSKNAQEFWRRWHISLGSWFRDYVYIPLGGSRRGEGITIRNLFVVWILTGFWHGASWNYVLWGLYYALFFLLERKLRYDRMKAWPSVLQHIYSTAVVVIGFGIYYFPKLRDIGNFLVHICGLNLLTERSGLVDIATRTSFLNNFFLIVIAVLACIPIVPKMVDHVVASKNDSLYRAAKIGAVVIGMFFLIICSIMMVDATNSPFLYWNY